MGWGREDCKYTTTNTTSGGLALKAVRKTKTALLY